MTAPGEMVTKGEARCVWVATAYWADTTERYVLFTTCRLTKRECQEALNEHPAQRKLTKPKIVKFEEKL